MSKVRKIEPIAKLPETAIKPKIIRVAVYARVSTDMEEQASSFEAQKDYYEKKVRENKDWILVDIYADEGKTGTSYVNRAEFVRMMDDCKLGKIDMILTKSVSRFARNTVDALNAIRNLKAQNIGVFFERENIWTLDAKGEFLITLLTSLAQEESRSISENTTWGKRKAFADGRYSVGYSSFLGYDRGPNKCEFVMNDEQAMVVRLIYRMFLQGYTAFKISQFLTRWGVKTPAEKDQWYSSSVMSILRNEKYKGDALLQKCFVKDFLSHKRVQNNGELPQYYVHDGHEAIINREVFDYVQTLIEVRNKDTVGRYSGVHLYSSLFRCGKCGALYGAKPEHSNDKYRRVILMCHRRFKAPYYCKNTRIDLRQIPCIFIKIVNKIMRKYPQILLVSEEIMKELSIDVDITINAAFSMDMQDISLVVKSATVYPENKIKIVLIDGTHMTIKV
jgi:site-specific DNA recombinase